MAERNVMGELNVYRQLGLKLKCVKISDTMPPGNPLS